jgi:hypothetical protein
MPSRNHVYDPRDGQPVCAGIVFSIDADSGANLFNVSNQPVHTSVNMCTPNGGEISETTDCHAVKSRSSQDCAASQLGTWQNPSLAIAIPTKAVE